VGTEGGFDIHAYDDTVIPASSHSNRPGYASELAYQSHTPGGYPEEVSFVGGETMTITMTDIVKDWLYYLEGTDGYFNNGIEIYDSLDDDYGCYWNTIEAGLANPKLEVNVVPIPGAVYLFGSGLIALIGLRRRKV